MKKIWIILLFLVAFSSCKSKSDSGKYVYIDLVGCAHANRHCSNLSPLQDKPYYAVKVYSREDPNLNKQYQYVCAECWDESVLPLK